MGWPSPWLRASRRVWAAMPCRPGLLLALHSRRPQCPAVPKKPFEKTRSRLPRLTPGLGSPGRLVFPACLGPLRAEATLGTRNAAPPAGESRGGGVGSGGLALCGEPGPSPDFGQRASQGRIGPCTRFPFQRCPSALPSALGPDLAWQPAPGLCALPGREGLWLRTPARSTSGKAAEQLC